MNPKIIPGNFALDLKLPAGMIVGQTPPTTPR
jgi:hypothetical protein